MLKRLPIHIVPCHNLDIWPTLGSFDVCLATTVHCYAHDEKDKLMFEIRNWQYNLTHYLGPNKSTWMRGLTMLAAMLTM